MEYDDIIGPATPLLTSGRGGGGSTAAAAAAASKGTNKQRRLIAAMVSKGERFSCLSFTSWWCCGR